MIARLVPLLALLVLHSVLLAPLAVVRPALAQTASRNAGTGALEARLRAIEQQIQAVQRRVFQGESPYFPKDGAGSGAGVPAATVSGDAALLADFSVKVAELERQLSVLTGKLEEVAFANRQLSERLERFEKDAEFRFQALEGTRSGGGAAAAAPAQATAPASRTAPVQQTVPTSPEDRYEAAQAMIRRGQFAEAETALSAFLADHPDHALAGNAQFWLGESYFARKNYPFAAKAYLEGYQRWPRSAKAPDMLLKLGLALAEMGQPGEACATLAKLAQDFPDAEQRIKAPAERERTRLNCR